MRRQNKKHKVIIEIDGWSATDLYSIGPKDLTNYFLPNRLNIVPEDVRVIEMIEEQIDENILTVHPESFKREDV